MRIICHPFKSDVIYLSWLDLLKLALGRRLEGSGVDVQKDGTRP